VVSGKWTIPGYYVAAWQEQQKQQKQHTCKSTCDVTNPVGHSVSIPTNIKAEGKERGVRKGKGKERLLLCCIAVNCVHFPAPPTPLVITHFTFLRPGAL